MHRSAWREALVLLEAPKALTSEQAQLWRAKCHLKLGEVNEAWTLARAFVESDHGDSASLNHAKAWAHSLIAKALIMASADTEALRWLARCRQLNPSHPILRRQMATLLTKLHGDWKHAALVWEPLSTSPVYERDVAWFALNRQIYCGAHAPEALTDQIKEFANQHLRADSSSLPTLAAPHAPMPTVHQEQRVGSKRKRIGLISPLFQSSPIYFMCMGALRHLSEAFDLVFFSRGSGRDWATDEFKSISSEWHSVENHGPVALERLLRRSGLQAIVDMSGWMDLDVLHALAARPAPKQFKWVGGQSTTTGMKAFDGFISDIHQSPPTTQSLYSEQLALMPGGYVTYSPPRNLPLPKKMDPQARRKRVGVVAHPMKLSPAFLGYLGKQIEIHAKGEGEPVSLEFVGWRFSEEALQRRIRAALGVGAADSSDAVDVQFLSTQGHRHQLEVVSELDWMVDTFPYTGGLTVLEALAVGVPVRTHAGSHCAARHGYSHTRFAGLDADKVDLQKLGPFAPGPLVKSGASLLPEQCARRDHRRLAADLAQLLQGRSFLGEATSP